MHRSANAKHPSHPDARLTTKACDLGKWRSAADRSFRPQSSYVIDYHPDSMNGPTLSAHRKNFGRLVDGNQKLTVFRIRADVMRDPEFKVLQCGGNGAASSATRRTLSRLRGVASAK